MNLNLVFDEPIETQSVKPFIPANFSGIYVVGDMPYDAETTRPYANSHYGTLCGLAKKAGFNFDNDCIQTNILPFFSVNRKVLDKHNKTVEASLKELEALMQSYSPRVIIILGRSTLKAFKRDSSNIDDERGCPFLWKGHLCLPTYHPAELYIKWHYYNIVLEDFRKAVRLGRDGWTEPQYEINYRPTFPEVVAFLNRIITEKPYLSMDLETQENADGVGYFTCCGFGINNKTAFVIPFLKQGNKRYFTYDEELIIWPLLARALRAGRFLGQNAVHYDHWYAAWHCGMLINVVDDNMFAVWEVSAEHKKSLGFQSSVYTDNTFHKDMLKDARSGRVARDEEFRYNGLDNIITLQAAQGIAEDMAEMPPAVKSHYRFNIQCSRVFQYMSLRGARVNRDLLSEKLGILEMEVQQMQDRLIDMTKKPKLNVRSPKQMTHWLYTELKLPTKYKSVLNKDTGEKEDRETSDFLTLAYMAREYPDMPELMLAAKLRKALKRQSSLIAIKTGPNGEVYWNFSGVGTETGRAAGYKPMNGMGVQPQNVDNRDRDLFIPPLPSQVWGKCDLEGADSWTVAGQMAVLGDYTMLNDLKAGLKPAQILALANMSNEISMTDTTEKIVPVLARNKAFFKTPEGKIVYATAKAVSHGTNYMMQAKTQHTTIFRRSDGELYVPVRQCEKYRMMYMRRYPGLQRLHDYIPTRLASDGYLDCPSGVRHQFFGRSDQMQVRKALSLLPQNNTAHATNTMLWNIFHQPYNRRADGRSLIVEPINQVHDEGDLAFHENELSLAANIFKRASEMQSEVWGIDFVIPFDPAFGPNWGACETDLYDYL